MNSDSLFKKTSSDMSDVNKLNMCKKLNMSESNNIKCNKLIVSMIELIIINHKNHINNNANILKRMLWSDRIRYFIGHTVPKIDINSYINRCFLYFKCNYVCHIYAIIYIDKLIKNNKQIFINHENYSRIYGTALVCACKFMEDDTFYNTYYADIIGITLNELNSLEKMFLIYIDYNLYVEPELYNKYHSAFNLYTE